ncbi:hypothetical protein LCM23_06425 [Cytobacillus kochii]|uniref:hypothetical protein n=1 Tax=Cytobacillus kochii TaxID=859143 RepID=UPI001CD35323|nr:hypothetical protein [Cytobacillus kochii]MCA1025721.1 hypothetical protein [Cytobacillus kochii]
MITRKSLLPYGRLIHLDNEKEIPEIWLEGFKKTHKVIGHSDSFIAVRSLNDSNKVRGLDKADIHYLLPNETSGYTSHIFECRL